MATLTLLILDSVGIGALPDAERFGDDGADTLGHIALTMGGLPLPHLASLGLCAIERPTPLSGCPAPQEIRGAWGKMAEIADGKDTATGHWEMMGLVLDHPLRTFPDGFPDDAMARFLEAIGRPAALGNRAASGTAIIEELGAEHLATGNPIVYTSADPVFQIAAHEDLVPVEELYRWCKVAYDIFIPMGLGRIIARPFEGRSGAFRRTHRRKDFALEPPATTFLDELVADGRSVHAIGKIASIFSGRGITSEVSTRDNAHGMEETLRAMRSGEHEFIFTNLVDFDMDYGHRRDPAGYLACLEAFDRQVPTLLDALREDDLLLISADHGNDPTWKGSDHTREYVPLLAAGPRVRPGPLGTRATFADLGRTILDFYGVHTDNPLGSSFLNSLGCKP